MGVGVELSLTPRPAQSRAISEAIYRSVTMTLTDLWRWFLSSTLTTQTGIMWCLCIVLVITINRRSTRLDTWHSWAVLRKYVYFRFISQGHDNGSL